MKETTMLTKEQVARTIDHAVLKPSHTTKDVKTGCALARKFRVASICVKPTEAALARQELKGSDVKVCVVIGFPHGTHRPEVKALEARLAIQDGAAELDMVMNVARFLSGDADYVRKDIEAVVAEARKHDVLVKVILETCYLSPDQIAQACRIAEEAGADFVKTSTGFGDGSATPEAVAVMLRTVGKTMGVKASGGIKTFQQAVAYLEQGCTRLGIGATEQVLSGAPGDSSSAGTY
jgi:deoxyribose-phosphate aldolase